MEFAQNQEALEQDGFEGLFDDDGDLFTGETPPAEPTPPATGAEGKPANQAAEPPKAPEAGQQPAQPPADDGWRLPIRHNHQDIELTRDEAIEYAQKGRNYDDVARERDTLRTQVTQVQPWLAELQEWAAQSNMTVEDYMAFARQQRRQASIDHELRQVMERYPDTPEDLAREIAQNRIGERDRAAQQQAQQAAMAQQQQAQQAEVEPWRAFVDAYPNIKDVAELPPGVMADIQGGMRPLDAMRKHELAEAQARIAALEKENQAYQTNQKNQSKATPGAQSVDGGGEKDPFEEGLFG